MSIEGTSNPPPSIAVFDWDAMRDETARKLADRWRRTDPASVDSAVNLAVATVHSLVQRGTAVPNPPGLIWEIADRKLTNESKRACKRREKSICDLDGDLRDSSPSPEEQLLRKEFDE